MEGEGCVVEGIRCGVFGRWHFVVFVRIPGGLAEIYV